jgi:hypothetical protein
LLIASLKLCENDLSPFKINIEDKLRRLGFVMSFWGGSRGILEEIEWFRYTPQYNCGASKIS